ncbi:ADP-ribosyltransferase domain protein SFB Type-3 [Candidatus Arthromitus sp. SFB-3]|nr:ADP-ribosyltransferase domain protein SFB Type-3 [Candidatus Arthromitus sp. SFB-3]
MPLSQVQVKKYNLLGKTFFNNLNFDEQQSLLMYTYRSRDINRKLSGEDHIKQVF